MRVAALNAAGVVPEPIIRTLKRLIRRTRWLVLVRGLCATVATAIGALLVVMAIDASVVLFSLSTRWVLTLSAYGLTAATAVWFLARPLAHSFTLAGIARTIETRHPELQERISSAVELLTSADAPEMRGSEQLIGALVEQATDKVGSIQPRREISLRAARPYLMAAAVVLAVLGGLFAVWPDQAALLLARASAPFLNRPNLLGADLDVSPGDAKIAEGQRLDVSVIVPMRAVRRATLHIVRHDGAEGALAMAPVLAGADARRQFSLSCPPAARNFRYRIHAGDAHSQYFYVTVVPRPAIERIIVQYDHPKYTRRERSIDTKSDGNIRALRGTTVTLTVKTNKPLVAVELVINDRPADAQPQLITEGDGAPGCAVRFPISPDVAGRWSLRLTGEDKFESSSAEHTIELVPDNPPTVAVIKPEEKKLRLPPTARVPIDYVLEDDIGVRRAELLVEIDGRPRKPRAIQLPSQKEAPLQVVQEQTTLELLSLNLRGAKYVTFQLRTTDGLPKDFGGPQHGLSDVYRIDLDIRAPSFEVANLLEDERQLRDTLQKVKKELLRAKRDSTQLRRELPKTKEPTEGQNKRVDDMRKKLNTADAIARRVAEQMKDGIFDRLADEVKELADKHIAKAENLAGQIKLADEPRERGILAKETDRTIDRAIKAVDELLEQIEPITDVARKALEMDELARREADLTKAKLAMDAAERPQAGDEALPEDGKAPDAPMTPEEWAKAQQDLANDLAEMLKEQPGGERAAAEMDQAAAQQAAEKAAELAKQQQDLADEGRALDQLQKVDNELAKLAGEQQKLADDAAGQEGARDQAAPMGKAADDIRADQLDEAIKKQAAAEEALEQKAGELAKDAGEQGQPAGEQGQPAGEQGQPAGEQGQPAGEQGQPAGEQGQPAGEQGQPAGEQGQPAGEQGQPAGEQGQPAGEQGQPAGEQGQPAGEQGQPAGEQGQPAGEQGQPAGEQGQPAGEQGQPAGEQAQQVGELAQRQAELRQKTEDLAAQRQELVAEHQERQLDRLQAQQEEVAREASDLANDVGDAAPQPDNIQDQAAGNAADAAQALERGQMPQAAQEAGQAGQELGQLAERLEEAVAEAFAPEGQQAGEAGQQAGEAGEQGGEAGEQGGEAGEQGGEAGEQGGEAGEQGGEAGQQGGEAGEQGGEAGQQGGEAGEQGGEAGEQGGEAGEQGGEAGEQGGEAGEQGGEAGQQGGEAGQQGGEAGEQGQQDGQPGGAGPQEAQERAELAQRAADLAERQQQLAGEMDALAQGDPLGQAAAQQDAIAQQAGELGQAAQQLQQRAEQLGLGAQAQQQAGQAAGQLAQAQQQAAQAAGQLAEAQPGAGEPAPGAGEPAPGAGEPAPGAGEPAPGAGEPAPGAGEPAPGAGPPAPGAGPPAPGAGPPAPGAGPPAPGAGAPGPPAPSAAQPAQQAAAQALAQAAQALAQMAQALGQAAGQAQQATPPEAQAGQQMAGAQQAAGQAAQSQSAMAAAQAAGQLGQMAAQAAGEAQGMGAQMQAAQNTMPQGGMEPKQGTGDQSTDLAKAQLKKLGIKLEDWARLPGELRDQILQAARDPGPAEYRVLIKRYFQEVARRGGLQREENKNK